MRRKRYRRNEKGGHRAAFLFHLSAKLDQLSEDVEGEVFGADDVAEMVERRATLPNVLRIEVVLLHQFSRFVLRHSFSPGISFYGWTAINRAVGGRIPGRIED
jgi:hypothetical protein